MTVLEIPIPPSVNSMFANRRAAGQKGRIKTVSYKDWRKEAGWALQSQPHAKVGGPVNILVEVRRYHGGADIDNFLKAPIDLLVLHKVIDDDRNVVQVTGRWADIDSCRVTIEAA